MKDWIPFIAVAVLAFIAGSLTMKQCSTPEVVNTVTVDTLRVTEWVRVTDWKVRTVKQIDTQKVFFSITDTAICCHQLDDCAEQLWSVINLEAEAEQNLPGGGLARVGFSMPLYREKPENAFFLQVTRSDTLRTETVKVYPERKWYDRINVSAGVGYGAGPLGLGPSVNIQAGYTLFELSDIWR